MESTTPIEAVRAAPASQPFQPVGEAALGSADLTTALYSELRAIAAAHMRKEREHHLLQPTALAHEAYLRLSSDPSFCWGSRTFFLTAAARVIREILVEHARYRNRKRRGGQWSRIPLAVAAERKPLQQEPLDVLELNEAISRLEQRHPRQARIVELRVFGGMTIAEIAQTLGIARRTVDDDWSVARAWLKRELDDRRNDDGNA